MTRLWWSLSYTTFHSVGKSHWYFIFIISVVFPIPLLMSFRHIYLEYALYFTESVWIHFYDCQITTLPFHHNHVCKLQLKEFFKELVTWIANVIIMSFVIHVTKQFHDNRNFQTNQGRFFENLEGKEERTKLPNTEDETAFWKGIWSTKIEQKRGTEWIDKAN